MKTTDYNIADIEPAELDDLRAISDLSLSGLQAENNNSLLLFPDSLQEYDREFGEKVICQISEGGKTIVTNSIIGFVGKNRTRLSIHSRFSDGDRDFFLHYMILRVAGINVFDLNHSISDDSILDLLIYLFPVFLKRALRQGIYRQYITRCYNDAHVKGVININRHIQNNTPFNGNIAYSKREYSCDNNITQLIRHTIEYINNSRHGAGIFGSDREMRECINTIVDVTPSYQPRKIDNVIYNNTRPAVHTFYSEYTALQKLCLQILRHDEIMYGNDEDEIYGVLFDAAWLWEEYLAKVISSKFDHYKKDNGPRFYLFENFQQIIPDYLSLDKRIVADAKYIPLNNQKYYREEKASAIYYKTITYMYRFCSNHGYLLYPHPDTESVPETYKIKTEQAGINGGYITKLGLRIPDPARCQDFSEFVSLMNTYEQEFVSKLP